MLIPQKKRMGDTTKGLLWIFGSLTVIATIVVVAVLASAPSPKATRQQVADYQFKNITTDWRPLAKPMTKEIGPFKAGYHDACALISQTEMQRITGKTIAKVTRDSTAAPLKVAEGTAQRLRISVHRRPGRDLLQ